MHTWITRHPQFFQSPIINDFIKVMLDDQTEPQLLPNFLVQVSIREIHKSLVSDPNDGGIKDSRDEDGKIIIGESTLRSLLLLQLTKMYGRYKIMC